MCEVFEEILGQSYTPYVGWNAMLEDYLAGTGLHGFCYPASFTLRRAD